MALFTILPSYSPCVLPSTLPPPVGSCRRMPGWLLPLAPQVAWCQLQSYEWSLPDIRLIRYDIGSMNL